MPSLKPLIRFIVIDWFADRSKAFQASNNHIILAERTMDDEQISCLVSAAYDPNMLVTGIEHQIAGLGLEYSARDCAPQPLKLSIHSGGIEHPCRCR